MKNNNKKVLGIALLTIAFLSCSIIVTAQKQERQGPPKVPNEKQIKRIVKDLSEELELTDNQSEEISDLYTSHFKEFSEIMGDRSTRPNREVMDKMKTDFENEVLAVLTKDQKKLYRKYIKQQKSERKNNQDPPR